MEKQREAALNRDQQSIWNIGNKSIFSLGTGAASRIRANLMNNSGWIS